MFKKLILLGFLGIAPVCAQAQNIGIINPQTNASALTSGTLPAGRMPALTGDCTTSAGAVATSCTKTGGVAFTGAATAAYTSAGSWTPSDGSGASLVFTGVSASYTQIGNMVFAYATLTYPSTANSSAAIIAGLPIATPNQQYARQCNVTFGTAATISVAALPAANATTVALRVQETAANVTNANMSTASLFLMCIYPAS